VALGGDVSKRGRCGCLVGSVEVHTEMWPFCGDVSKEGDVAV